MEIEGTTFGTITIEGKTYEHDVIIRLSGEVVKRRKKLSKKYYGTSHVLSKDEAKFVFERRAAHSRLGPDGQCASLVGSRGLFRKEGLQGSVAAHPRGNWCVQQVAYKEDRAFSRDLLKRTPRQRWSDKRFSRAGVTSFGW